MLSTGQSAGNIWHPSSPFVSAKRERKGISQLAVTVEVNPTTSRPKGRDLLRVDPERRFLTPPSKAGLGAAEWVKRRNRKVQLPPWPKEASSCLSGIENTLEI